jgi:hypothetical protein
VADVVALRPANNLQRHALIFSASASRYPGASLDTRYVARLARYCIGDVLECDPLLLVGKDRGSRKLAFARQLAIHLTHIVAGRRHQEVARAFDRNRSTASHHFEVLENLRDIPEFDAFLTVMETRFAAILRSAETRPLEAWGKAVDAMIRSVRRGELEADTHYDAKFVAETFRTRPIPEQKPKATAKRKRKGKGKTTRRRCRKAKRRVRA